MCGIAGFLALGGGVDPDASRATLQRMTDALVYRGPDADGFWVDEQIGIALGHRRLAIIDLSATGSQPMVSHDGACVIVFNGEIYNFRELRAALDTRFQNIAWRGTSDTEVLLETIARLGMTEALRGAVGMFSLALWHRGNGTLQLARDRLGEKPLYYGRVQDRIVFASELKAIRALPGFAASVDRDALCGFLRHSYIPSPQSIYTGVSKLPAGCVVTINTRQSDARPSEPVPYWRLSDAVGAALFTGDAQDATLELERLLKQSVRGQMIADVPLGAFLSGGIDSSLIVALMQAESARPVKTFTIGFNEPRFNEAVFAKAVAVHLGTEHHELYVDADDALQVIPRLAEVYDEPFADSSQIPTLLIAQLARQSVTVSLSGDGGDELFSGYARYRIAAQLWSAVRLAPSGLRRALGSLLARVTTPNDADRVDASQQQFGQVLRQRLHRVAPLLSSKTDHLLYHDLVSQWRDPERIVLGGHEHLAPAWDGQGQHMRLPFKQRMLFIDTLTYLPDDILTKVDRAAMSASLETRMPLLDHRIVEFVWSLPAPLRLQQPPKAMLRNVLYRYVPRELIERPKRGFGVPLNTWLRGPLRDWAESLLNAERLQREGYFAVAPIRNVWQAHLDGKHNWQHLLWNVLMFQSWLEAQDRSS